MEIDPDQEQTVGRRLVGFDVATGRLLHEPILVEFPKWAAERQILTNLHPQSFTELALDHYITHVNRPYKWSWSEDLYCYTKNCWCRDGCDKCARTGVLTARDLVEDDADSNP
jgi:hypothetical protein